MTAATQNIPRQPNQAPINPLSVLDSRMPISSPLMIEPITLPVLDGDRLVGRVTPKLDRRASLLDILGVEWESGVKVTAARRSRLQEALERLAAFVAARAIRLPR